MVNKKAYLKDMKINPYNLEVGDIITSIDGTVMYVVLKKIFTLLHSHPYYRVMYLHNGNIQYWLAEELMGHQGRKNIKRIIVPKQEEDEDE